MTTLTLMIIINAVLAAALLAGLAFVMSRAGLLTPHRPGVTGNAWRLRRHQPSRAHGERVSPRLSPALD
ncbi:MAG TPA: hypothetical protein VHT29_04005 [Solirubrobacteraceae bacterium]|nr:hypothetical protein [Solirubrobacteraceae bacterium]